MFIAINIAENLVWHVFSPVTISGHDGDTGFEGIFINLVHRLLTENFSSAMNDAFFREKGDNICNLLTTIVIICLVFYLEGW